MIKINIMLHIFYLYYYQILFKIKILEIIFNIKILFLL